MKCVEILNWVPYEKLHLITSNYAVFQTILRCNNCVPLRNKQFCVQDSVQFTFSLNEHKIGFNFISTEFDWRMQKKNTMKFSLTESSLRINLILIHTSSRREERERIYCKRENSSHWDPFACIAFMCTFYAHWISWYRIFYINRKEYQKMWLCVA